MGRGGGLRRFGNRHLVPLRRRAPWQLLSLGVTLSIVVGLAANHVPSGFDSSDRVVIGNTAGVLAVVIEVKNTRIVIGGGDSRVDLADFVDRSTLPFPWTRKVDLLVVPSWDDTQAIGAVGLVERGGVDGILVIGIPGSDPIWTFLERAAQRTGARIAFADGHQRLQLGEDVSLAFTVPDDEGENDLMGAAVSLRYHDTRLVWLDTPSEAPAWLPASMEPRNTHIIVSARPPASWLPPDVPVLVRPAPRRSGPGIGTTAHYIADMPRGKRLTIRLAPREMRLPATIMQPGEATLPRPAPYRV